MIQRPDDKTWAAFVSAIQVAAKLFAEIDAKGDGGQAGAMAALAAVQDMLQSCGAQAEEYAPFLRLQMAFSDLKAGAAVDPIFLPTKKPSPGPKPIPSTEAVQRAILAALLETLIRQGEFSTVPDAARWVARKARNLKAFKTGRKVGDDAANAEKLMAWRDGANAGSPDDLDASVFRAFNKDIAASKPVGRDGITAALLRAAKVYGAPQR